MNKPSVFIYGVDVMTRRNQLAARVAGFVSLNCTCEEFYNKCHGKGGKFCGGGSTGSGEGGKNSTPNGSFSPGVKKYLKDQYQMSPAKAKELGLSQDGTKLLIPFKDESGKTTGTKWRDTAVKEGIGRWGPSESLGLSVYRGRDKKGPLYVVESPSEGLILAAHGHNVVFFDGADSLVSRTGIVNKRLKSRLTKITKGNHSILIPDNDIRGEAFAKAVEPLVTQRVNPPSPHKDLRDFLVKGQGDLSKLIAYKHI